VSAEWVTAIATAGTFVVIAASAVAALIQLRHMRGSNQIAALNEMRETIESQEFQRAERFVALELSKRLSEPDVQRAMLDRYFPEEFQPMRMIANFFENMGVFVKSGIIDKSIACNLWNQVVLRNWNAIAPVAQNRRVATEYPGLWENFEYLAMLSRQWERDYANGTYPRGMERMPSAELWPVTLELRRSKR
jgi:hypothetical protein